MIKAIKNNWHSIFYAFLLCFYYIVPHFLAIIAQMLFLLTLLINKENRITKKNIKPLTWYTIFTLFLIITNIFRIDFANGIAMGYLTTTINNIVFVWITILVIRNKERVNVFLDYFGLSGFFLSLLILPYAILLMQMGGGRLGTTVEIPGMDFLNNPITLGYILLIINICQFFSLVNTRFLVRKLFYLICFGCSFFCVLLSGTRKALVGCVLCYVAYLFFNNKSDKRKLLIYLIVGVVSLLLFYQLITEVEFLYTSIGKRMEGSLGYVNSDIADADGGTEARVDLVRKGMDIFMINPIFGVGIEEAQKLIAIHSHPHNNYVALLDFGGIVTFLSYYWFYIIQAFRGFRRLYDAADVVLFCLLLSFFVGDYTATTYNINYFTVFLTIMYLNTLYTRPKMLEHG